jgi:hypothetical protein
MSDNQRPDDAPDPVEELDPDAAAGGGGVGSEPSKVADNAETVPDPDAPAPVGEQGAAARRQSDRIERHSERETTPIAPSSPSPPGSPRDKPPS